MPNKLPMFPLFDQWQHLPAFTFVNDREIPPEEIISGIECLLEDVADSFYESDILLLSRGELNKRITTLLSTLILSRMLILPEHLKILCSRVRSQDAREFKNFLIVVSNLLRAPTEVLQKAA